MKAQILLRTLAAAAALAASPLVLRPALAEGEAIHVMKTATCGCCAAWVDHLKEAGLTVTTTDMAQGELTQKKIEAGLTPELASCHTAEIEGYVVEGHVPAADIARLIEERPEAIGLAVPGMPAGSPGMDYGRSEPYEVLLVKKDGTTEIFATHE